MIPAHTNRIAIAGRMGAGKDHVGRIVGQFLKGPGSTLSHTSFSFFAVRSYLADRRMELLKLGEERINSNPQLRHYFARDWPLAPTRAILQARATRMAERDPLSVLRQVADWAGDYAHPHNILVLTGVRYPHEVVFLRELGFIVGLVSADEETRVRRIYERNGRTPTNEELNHPSERALDGYSEWDWKVKND